MTTPTLTYDAGNSMTVPRERLNLSWSEYKWPLSFLLSMSMMGLWFPLGFILVPFILINRFRNNRYDFVIMLTVFLCGAGFIAEGTLPVKTGDIAFALAIILALVHRNRGIVSKTIKAWLCYCIAIFAIAMFSEEVMSIQIRTMRYLFMFIGFIIPITCFAGKEFDMRQFFRHLLPYVIIIWLFYILDGFVVCGFIFLPRTPLEGSIPESTFYQPWAWGFPNFIRKYPQGLIFTVLAIFPLCKYYKLKISHWLLFLGACAACQTFTVISGLAIGPIVCLANRRTIIKYAIAIPVIFVSLYYIDGMLPQAKKEGRPETALRIKSSIDQILALQDVEDDVDLADLGSGRLGQAIPKIELVNSLGRQMTGLGFLHPTLTTNPKYIIDNEYYLDSEKSEEGATKLIETEVLQVYVTSGWFGLIVYFIFFPYTYYIVRNKRYSRYYLSVLMMTFWLGMGAYGGWTAVDGQLILSLAFGVTILGPDKELDHATP